MVYRRIDYHDAIFSAHISTLSWNNLRRTGLLFYLSRFVQYRMGLHADQSYESRSIAHLFSKTKGNNLIIQDTLNNYRNSFTFLANCVVLGLGLAVFTLMKEK